MKKQIIILGATGSVGGDVLEVVRANPGDFEIVGISCGKNFEKMAEIAEEFEVEVTGGAEDVLKLAAINVDLVVNCLMGEIGTSATLSAVRNGNNVALANKESLVAAGAEIVELAASVGVEILPIDSEICAIHQCLRGRNVSEVEKIVLTCSGGPFFGKNLEELEGVGVEDALAHPTWPNMGKKITIDSATLMNKGFEVIETAVLFGISPDRIEVLVHPQSLVHAIVYFKDGNMLMHSSVSDMKVPISYCLYYPETKQTSFERLNLANVKLEFFEPDIDTFTNLGAAYSALREGRTKELLRENDRRVELFLDGKLKFTELFQ